jgi:hypothetical protein
MSKTPPKELIYRDQEAINSMSNWIETARLSLQAIIDEALKIKAHPTSDNWQQFLNNPHQTAIDQITADIPIETVGGFQKKRSAVLADLDLPDTQSLVKASERLKNDLKRLGVSANLLTVVKGKAKRNEPEFLSFVEGCSIYATDLDLWHNYKALETAINQFNQILGKYGRSPINLITPLKQYFTLSNTGELIASPEKYVSVVNS